MTTNTRGHVLLIDDERSFIKAAYADRTARTSRDGLALLAEYKDQEIHELWLDHDLGKPGGVLDDIKPVVYELERAGFVGEPYLIGTIIVHTSNSTGGDAMVKGLERQGYNVRRVYAGDHLNIAV